MIQQFQPVSTRYGQTFRLESRDHRIEQSARPAPDQHKNVLRLHRTAHPFTPFFHPDRLAPVNHALDLSGQVFRQLGLRRGLAHGIDRPVPGIFRHIFGWWLQRPQFNTARLVFPPRRMFHKFRHHRRIRRMRALNRRRRVPHLVDKFQNLRRRAERHVHGTKQHVLRQLRKLLCLLAELRLFLVADHEQGSRVLQALGAHA